MQLPYLLIGRLLSVWAQEYLLYRGYNPALSSPTSSLTLSQLDQRELPPAVPCVDARRVFQHFRTVLQHEMLRLVVYIPSPPESTLSQGALFLFLESCIRELGVLPDQGVTVSRPYR